MPNNYNQYKPYTGFFTGTSNQDLGERYITKAYLLDYYPSIISQMGGRVSAGLWTWGRGSSGVLGLGDEAHRSSPVQIGSLVNWKKLAIGNSGKFISALKHDEALWVWGDNTNGELGLGNTTHRSSPVQVGSRQDWRYAVASYNQTYASINSQFEY